MPSSHLAVSGPVLHAAFVAGLKPLQPAWPGLPPKSVPVASELGTIPMQNVCRTEASLRIPRDNAGMSAFLEGHASYKALFVLGR